MNLNHREPIRMLPKPAIPERLPSPKFVRHNPAPGHGQTDNLEIEENAICLEIIVLNSDLDFF